MAVKSNWKWVLVLLLCAVFMISLFSCAPADVPPPAEPPEEEEEVEETRGGTLIVGYLQECQTLDPQMVNLTFEAPIVKEIHDTLMRFDADLNMYPSLAESYEVIDPSTYRFKLHEGVLFHNGREMVAEDVRYSLLRAKDPDLEIRRRFFEHIDDVEVLNDYEVEIRLSRPDPAFLNFLTYAHAAIVPQEEVESAGEAFGARPVGAGPFKFVSWDRDAQIVLEAFDDFHRGRPHLDQIIIRTIPDQAVMLLELESGGIHIAEELFEDAYDRVVARDDIVIGSGEGTRYLFLQFNVGGTEMGAATSSPFEDLRVRQAVYHAVEWDLVQRSFAPTEVFGTPAYSFVPSSNALYSEDSKDLWPSPAYDPERAKQLLADAGYPDGFTTTIHMGRAEQEKYAIPMQAYLKEVGIDVKLELVEVATWVEIVNAGDFEMTGSHRTASNPDPLDMYQQFHSSSMGSVGNRHFYSNPEVDELLDQAIVAMGEERIELFRKAEELIIADMPQIPILNDTRVMAWNKKVNGFQVFPPRGWLDNWHLEKVTLSQ